MVALKDETHSQDEAWMERAVALARRGEGATRPNPPVGAVVVRAGEPVGRGYHARAGRPHAEMNALRNAGAAARHATLYVTLEPCCTHGRTPPCTQHILQSGIREVVIGALDPNPPHRGRGVRLLRRHGIRVRQGVCRSDCEALIEPFAKWIGTGRPFVTLKLAMTLDGRIGDRQGCSKWITGPAARRRVQDLRKRVDGVLVGSGTAVADDPSLRFRGRRRRPLYRIVADSRGRLSPKAQVLADGHADETIVAVTRLAPARRTAQYAAAGAEVWVLPSREGHVSLERLLDRLGKMGLLHLLCEGGGRLAEALLRAGIVDRLLLFVAPKVIGDRRAVPAVGGRGWTLDAARALRFVSEERIGDDLLITAVPAGRE